MYGCVHRGKALCLVMKCYPRSLADLLEERQSTAPLRPGEVLPIALQVANALAQLHAADIVVRDLKPSNVLVDDDGSMVISDFGIAHYAETTLTQATATTGGESDPFLALLRRSISLLFCTLSF